MTTDPLPITISARDLSVADLAEERWDVPNDRLRRLAETPEMPMARACPHCKHRHPRGELCGHLLGRGDGMSCRCLQ